MSDEFPDVSKFKNDSKHKKLGTIRADVGMMFKAFYDKALDSGMTAEPFFNASKINYQLSTLQNRMSEALRFLTLVDVPGSKYTKEQYKELKRRTKLFKFEYNGQVGIVLRYTSFGSTLNGEIEIINTISGTGKLPLWRIKLDEFLNDPTMTYLELKTTADLGAILSPEDREYIARTFDSADLIWEFVEQGFKVIRV